MQCSRVTGHVTVWMMSSIKLMVFCQVLLKSSWPGWLISVFVLKSNYWLSIKEKLMRKMLWYISFFGHLLFYYRHSGTGLKSNPSPQASDMKCFLNAKWPNVCVKFFKSFDCCSHGETMSSRLVLLPPPTSFTLSDTVGPLNWYSNDNKQRCRKNLILT